MSRPPDRSRPPAALDAPFSRPFSVDELLRRPDEPVTVEAEPEELKALAAADGLPAIHSLKGEFRVVRQGKEIWVRGDVRARVTQDCVVTLEPFDTDLVEPVEVRFAFAPVAPPEPKPAERMSRRRAAQESERRRPAPEPVFPSHEDDNPPDPIVDGRIDLGALAAEFMALGLDPYPRKPGVEFSPVQDEGEPEESPFAGLARLKKDS